MCPLVSQNLCCASRFCPGWWGRTSSSKQISEVPRSIGQFRAQSDAPRRSRKPEHQQCPGPESQDSQHKVLSGPISRDIAILLLRYPISRDSFSGRLALPQNGVRYPPLVLSFTHAHLCDSPFCSVSRDNCAIPHKNTSTKEFCDRCKYRAI